MKQALFENYLKLGNGIVTYSRDGGGASKGDKQCIEELEKLVKRDIINQENVANHEKKKSTLYFGDINTIHYCYLYFFCKE